jgi:hypothetical protein
LVAAAGSRSRSYFVLSPNRIAWSRLTGKNFRLAGAFIAAPITGVCPVSCGKEAGFSRLCGLRKLTVVLFFVWLMSIG